MGFSVSWMAVQNGRKESVLSALGMLDTGKPIR
jgi:hypothetical protein